ncbi:MAG: bifunctional nuclease family protein [Fimbriimonadaceae bacterium]|nr:bifunctional nuclease family protein [Fimbriimonadaceae bacterium]
MADEREPSDDQGDFSEPPPFFPVDFNEHVREPGSLGKLIQVQIDGVFASETNGQTTRFVLVTDGRRRLPIVIGPFEAQAISLPLDGAVPDRPMTHDLFKTIVDRVGGDVDRVVIDDLWNAIYYAKVYLKVSKDEFEIDARPSDAIAIAVRFDAPIYVAEGILDMAIED